MPMKIDLSQKTKPAAAFDLSALLGGGQAEGAVVTQLPLGRLVAYPNQPFKAYSEERLSVLAEDIRANGVLSPIIVRPKGDMYEVLAGHNRWNASRRAGKDTIPAIIRAVDDDAAALIMVNTNLNQRDKLLPSEKAFAYKVQLEAMKRQGQRTDLTCSHNGNKLAGTKSSELLAEQMGESKNQIFRYIRLTELIPDLLEQVDGGELSMLPAVALSYLPHEEQEAVLRVSADCERKISVAQAEQLKKMSGRLTEQVIAEVLLPLHHWNAQQEFVLQSRILIPREASPQDVANLLTIIGKYFNKGVSA